MNTKDNALRVAIRFCKINPHVGMYENDPEGCADEEISNWD